MTSSARGPRRVAVVGAGPAGTALALGLLQDGHDVTLVSDRSAAQIRDGSVMSSQITFESALEMEVSLGIDELLPDAPSITHLGFSSPTARFSSRLGAPARSVDQRVRLPILMEEVARRGGKVVIRSATADDLEELAGEHDLVVVSTGRGGLTDLFAIDDARTPYDGPQRVVTLAYIRGMQDGGGRFGYHAVPGVGECFTCPALTVDGSCDIVVLEAVPGGPLDRWDAGDPARTLETLLAENFEDVWLRLRDGWGLVDEQAVIRGGFRPVVRDPVGTLPGGHTVLGMADVVVLNDPVTSQGANNAIKSAAFYREAITAHDGPLDEAWMRRTFDNFWRGWASWATTWTNSWLRSPAAHQQAVLEAAARHPVIAERVAAGFDDARLFHPWWFDADAAAAFIAQQSAAGAGRFDTGELRRSLGQYATGVTVVTAVHEGQQFGMTANSFTSVSINPPLVLWAAARSSPSLVAFEESTVFAVNVLASDQHHLSRQFSMSGSDKFDGVLLDRDDPPVLTGTVAHFVCRRTQRIDAGDHVLFLGEIEEYDAPGGEPLVFHSGFYRLATRHPDI